MRQIYRDEARGSQLTGYSDDEMKYERYPYINHLVIGSGRYQVHINDWTTDLPEYVVVDMFGSCWQHETPEG